jgi:hypothetical protein
MTRGAESTAWPRVLGPEAIAETAAFIASVQRPTGQIPWFPGGHTDPWDHIEAAMALNVAGRHVEAEAAYEWLRRTQNPDGSWYRGYADHAVTDAVRESNFTAYVAVGVWHHFQTTNDSEFLDRMWPTLSCAMGFVLGLQAPSGQVMWARAPDGTPADEALLTGCASMYQSLRCALAVAERRSDPRPDWELAAAALGHAIAAHPSLFSPRDRYSMDWYYPVLGGALTGVRARERLDGSWDRFVVPGFGVRCVSHRPWVTVAETSELVLALCAVGETERAAELLGAVVPLRCADGSYWTGYVVPDDVIWPEERTTWTAGAVVLASAALTLHPATVAVFGGRGVPAGLAAALSLCGTEVCAA